ncbi:MAG: hypothetical protein ABFS23_08565 [Pseudomonadota bacterium]
MSEHFNGLADKTVEAFRELLDEPAKAAVGDEGFSQLSMLIESYITDAVLEHLEQVADQVGAVATNIRHDAERFRS